MRPRRRRDLSWGGGSSSAIPSSTCEGSPRASGAVGLRKLEEVLIRSCADFGVAAHRVPGMTGKSLWTLRNQAKDRRHRCSHFARRDLPRLRPNVSTDLGHFKLIIPCGIGDKPVTSLDCALGDAYPGNRGHAAYDRGSFSVGGAQLRPRDDSLGGHPGCAGRAVGVPMKLPENLRELDDDETFSA